MGRSGSGPEFHVNSGSGRVGSLHLWVGLDRVKKIGPTFNSDIFSTDGRETAFALRATITSLYHVTEHSACRHIACLF